MTEYSTNLMLLLHYYYSSTAAAPKKQAKVVTIDPLKDLRAAAVVACSAARTAASAAASVAATVKRDVHKLVKAHEAEIAAAVRLIFFVISYN